MTRSPFEIIEIQQTPTEQQPPQECPAMVTVLATLNFLFGGLWMMASFSCYLFYGICVWFGTVFSFGFLSPQKVHDSLYQHAAAPLIGITVQAFIIAPLTILGGWGLLRMRNWGRWLSIAAGPIAGMNLLTLALIWQIKSINSGGVIFLTCFGALMFLYPALLSVYMAHPAIAAAFPPSSRLIRR